MSDGWTGRGKVRAREIAGGGVEIVVEGRSTQARVYTPLLCEFFRKEWRAARPTWAEMSVEILMDYHGAPPWLDLADLAKAILDACKGYAFHDDAQVARLLVERRSGERERITIRVTPREGTATLRR